MRFKDYSEDKDFDNKHYKHRAEHLTHVDKYEADAIPLTKSEIETLTNKDLFEHVIEHPTNPKRVIVKADHTRLKTTKIKDESGKLTIKHGIQPTEAAGVILPAHAINSMNELHKKRLAVYGKMDDFGKEEHSDKSEFPDPNSVKIDLEKDEKPNGLKPYVHKNRDENTGEETETLYPNGLKQYVDKNTGTIHKWNGKTHVPVKHPIEGRQYIDKKTGTIHHWDGKKYVPVGYVGSYNNSAPISAREVARRVRNHINDHFTVRQGETEESARERQIKDEKESVERLKKAGFLSKDGDLFSDSEKTETLKHDAHPETGEKYEDAAIKGTAAYDAHLDDEGNHHIVKTCPGQSEGCGGGLDSERISDPKNGLCFAPNAETQYIGARAKRHALSVLAHSPHHQIQKDFALALSHNVRNRHESANRNGLSLLVRPDTTDQTDNNKLRHLVDKLNEQNKKINKNSKKISTYAYGKTNEVNDPENGHHRIFSNIGPKVKNGEIHQEAVDDDQNRVNQTTDLNKTKNKVNKNSYLTIGGPGIKKGTQLTDRFSKAARVGVYWETGKHPSQFSEEERRQPPLEAHYDGEGKLTTFEKSHHGYVTKGGLRFYYQKQNILHQHNNTVDVGLKDKKGRPKLVESDARHLDNEKLKAQGKVPFMTRSGHESGNLIVTTPTRSTSNSKILTNKMNHDVNQKTVEDAESNGGFWHIDHPDEQLKAMSTPTDVKGFWKKGQGRVD